MPLNPLLDPVRGVAHALEPGRAVGNPGGKRCIRLVIVHDEAPPAAAFARIRRVL
jgi:hypothetical protein